jgi:glutamine amidotransferase-like uncharacterized protein
MELEMRFLLAFAFVLAFGSFSAAQEKPIRVALYVDKKTGESKREVLKVMKNVEMISAEGIRAGKLNGFDVLLMPGGRGKQGKILEEKGRDEIRAFVKNGGSYLGICAGAYLATNDYKWSLGILNAKVVDKKHWDRGNGSVKIAMNERGKRLLNTQGKETEMMVYRQGPLFAPGANKDLPAFEALATFETEIADNYAITGVMKGTVAIAAGKYGKGRVLCFSPHPEKMESTHEMLRSGLMWLNEK